jgi:ankyrin repeat protein
MRLLQNPSNRKGYDYDLLSAILDAGIDINAQDRQGKTALMLYLGKARDSNFYEDPKIVEFLVRRGADVNARDMWGRTALMMTHTPEVAEILVKNGTDINAVSDVWEKRYTPGGMNTPELIDWWIFDGWYMGDMRRSGKESSLMRAIQNGGNLALATKLIELGSDVNLQDVHGRTALIFLMEIPLKTP